MSQTPASLLSFRRVVAFDGDDTLWKDGADEQDWERSFNELTADRLPCPAIAERFRSLLNLHGYTIGGVREALLESARDTCGDDLPSEWISQVKALPDLCAGLKITPSQHFDRVEALGRSGTEIWLITKGDLVRQAIKVARFGRAHRFARIEIVPTKNKAAFADILERANLEAHRFTMIGDSLADDIFPAWRAGASAIHVPSGRWALLRPFERLLPSGRIRVARSLADACEACAVSGARATTSAQ